MGQEAGADLGGGGTRLTLLRDSTLCRRKGALLLRYPFWTTDPKIFLKAA